jgi:hypothetical protein
MCAARQHPTRGDVESVDFADPDPTPETRTGPFRRMPAPDERVAIRLDGHPYTYVVRVQTGTRSGPRLTELSITADDGDEIDYNAVRAVPVRRLAVTAAQWINRGGGLFNVPQDLSPEFHTQPENNDPRVFQAAQIADKAIALGLMVRPTVAAELNVSTRTVDRLLKRAKAAGWFDDVPLPKRPPPQQRDTTAKTTTETTTKGKQ